VEKIARTGSPSKRSEHALVAPRQEYDVVGAYLVKGVTLVLSNANTQHRGDPKRKP
jgi:hypothetical protein